MDWVAIRNLHSAGVRFGSHLASHRSADSLSSDELLREAARSRYTLEAGLGVEVTAVAPPFGFCDERTVRTLETCGYRAGFTTRKGIATLDESPLALPRIEVEGGWTLDCFARALGLAG